ncbi:hypothetical protein P171DRAFT_492128 [Karstenula rhodostoma CBS 690.94]|uniref:DUF7730 domain-containing protein n=1 Tax=Karstenula rhodostoma CBS 690.94 TaxID=1392251 RepID=A0A9P4P309_9PLEO|nr:hypothetical protein P171DRAFT_492128 [Karstenula rhodostoma CBS 690.94]
MAARKKATPTTSMSSDAVKIKRVIFKQRKVLKGVRALKSSSRESAGLSSERAWEVKKRENGLVDMGKTPPWMVEVAKRNATDSPLLRLPGELRNKIWRYATASNIVNMHDDDSRPDAVVCKGHTVGVVGEDNPIRWLSTRAEDKPRLPTAFHLSEVCRQIYHEVGTLAYSDSIFFFCNWNDEGALIRAWTRTLTSAHRNAITDIAIDDMNFDFYLDYRIKLCSIFLGLQRLHLNTHRVNLVYVLASDEKNGNLVCQKRKRLEDKMQKRVDRRESGGVELVWHDDPIEDYEMWEDTDDDSKADRSFPSVDTTPDSDGSEEDSGPKWNIYTHEEDLEGENETDYQVGANGDEVADSEGDVFSEDDDDDLDYDSEMLDLGPS